MTEGLSGEDAPEDDSLLGGQDDAVQQPTLAALLSQHKDRRNLGDARIATLASERVGIPSYVTRSSVRNWSSGSSSRVNNWRQLAAIAAVLQLDLDEADALMTAGSCPRISDLRRSVPADDQAFLSHWTGPASTASVPATAAEPVETEPQPEVVLGPASAQHTEHTPTGGPVAELAHQPRTEVSASRGLRLAVVLVGALAIALIGFLLFRSGDEGAAGDDSGLVTIESNEQTDSSGTRSGDGAEGDGETSLDAEIEVAPTVTPQPTATTVPEPTASPVPATPEPAPAPDGDGAPDDDSPNEGAPLPGLVIPPATLLDVPPQGVQLGGDLIQVAGRATHPVNVAEVWLLFRNQTDVANALYWNPVTGTWETEFVRFVVPVELVEDTYVWSYQMPIPAASGDYRVRAWAVTEEGAIDPNGPKHDFTVQNASFVELEPGTGADPNGPNQIVIEEDKPDPVSAVLEPADGAIVGTDVTISGTASHVNGVANLEMILRRLEPEEYWRPDLEAWGEFQRFTVAVDSPGANQTTWSWQVPVELEAGEYRVRVWARGSDDERDEARNQSDFTVVIDG